MDTNRIPPSGDPFTSAPPHPSTSEDRPCGCWDGFHWLGIAVEDPDMADGEGIVYERVPCRRCADTR